MRRRAAGRRKGQRSAVSSKRCLRILLWRCCFALLVLAPLCAYPAETEANPDATAASSQSRPNSILVFAGRLSTTDFASTLLFNLRYTPEPGKPAYDNDIAGIEYERDVYELARNLRLRVEGGLADRFGHYLVCCQPGPYPDATVTIADPIHSLEAWGGGKVRWENLPLGGFAKLALAGTVGLSAVTRPIGRERQREIDDHGNAHVLFYIAPEVAASLNAYRNFELVIRVPHRSGAGGTLGHMEEGYNADVVGIRYYF